MMEFYTENHPVARKKYQCHICLEPIFPGERYSRESGKYEGEFFDHATCPACYGLREDDFNINEDYEYDYWSLVDFAQCKYCDSCKFTDENGDCDEEVLSCPIIRKHYEQKVLEYWKK